MSENVSMERPRDAERSRAAILGAAVEVFAEQGFSGGRVAEIARRARVPAGLLYHYYRSKRELFEAAHAHALHSHGGELIQMLQKPDADLPDFEHLLRSYFGLLASNPRLARLTAWWYVAFGGMQGSSSPNALFDLKDAAVRFVARIQERGRIREDADPEGLVLSSLALCQHWHITSGENARLMHGASDPNARRLEQIVEVVMRSARP